MLKLLERIRFQDMVCLLTQMHLSEPESVMVQKCQLGQPDKINRIFLSISTEMDSF